MKDSHPFQTQDLASYNLTQSKRVLSEKLRFFGINKSKNLKNPYQKKWAIKNWDSVHCTAFFQEFEIVFHRVLKILFHRILKYCGKAIENCFNTEYWKYHFTEYWNIVAPGIFDSLPLVYRKIQAFRLYRVFQHKAIQDINTNTKMNTHTQIQI